MSLSTSLAQAGTVESAETVQPSNQRSRRFPYTVVACERCQRRKCKCSGGHPCERCRDSRATCRYRRTTRFRSGHHSTGGSTTSAGIKDLTPPESQTVSAHIDCASTNSTLSSVELSPGSFDYYLRLIESSIGSSSPKHLGTPPINKRASLVSAEQMRQVIAHRERDFVGGALAALDNDTWLELLKFYQEEIGMQYPFIDIDALSREISTEKQPGQPPHRQHSPTEDVSVLVFAVLSNMMDSSIVEFAEPVVEEILARALVKTNTQSIDKDVVSVLILTSMYFFLSDREVLAYRGIGTVLRLLQEIECQDDPNEPSEMNDKIYWTVYTLDRRWSFGTGLPFAVSEADVTRKIQLLDDTLSSQYLLQMVAYCGIASEFRKLTLDNSASTTSSSSARDFLNFRVLQWQQNLPVSLRFHGISDKYDPLKEQRGDYKLRLMLYLRANQMRTVILRKFATHLGQSAFDTSTAHSIAEIARDTIQVLVILARETDIYHAQHKTFNHFLETALSSLLLILCSLDMNQYPACAEDVLMALELVRQLAIRSPISMRLRDKLQGVQKIVFDASPQDAEPHKPLSMDTASHTDQQGTGPSTYRNRSGQVAGGDIHTQELNMEDAIIGVSTAAATVSSSSHQPMTTAPCTAQMTVLAPAVNSADSPSGLESCFHLISGNDLPYKICASAVSSDNSPIVGTRYADAMRARVPSTSLLETEDSEYLDGEHCTPRALELFQILRDCDVFSF